jgi:hypothetical protein
VFSVPAVVRRLPTRLTTAGTEGTEVAQSTNQFRTPLILQRGINVIGGNPS